MVLQLVGQSNDEHLALGADKALTHALEMPGIVLAFHSKWV